MPFPYEVSPQPLEKDVLVTSWQHWFALLRLAVNALNTFTVNLASQVNVLRQRLDNIDASGAPFLRMYVKSGDPTNSELKVNTASIWYNPSEASVKMWVIIGATRYFYLFTPMDTPP